MSNQKNNEKKSLDELQKNSRIDELKENELGELQGGFSDVIAQEAAERIITINFKCGQQQAT